MSFPWKAVAVGGAALGAVGVGLLVVKTYEEKHRRPAPKRVALIGDSYAVGLGPELAKIYPDLVLVALGVNDPKPDLKNYQTIVRGLHGIGARVVWIEPPLGRNTLALYNTIQALGVERVGPPNIPLAADGLHPTSYTSWASDIAETV